MKAVHCPCGKVIEAQTDDELVERTQQHVRETIRSSRVSTRGRRSSRLPTITEPTRREPRKVGAHDGSLDA